MSYEEDVSIETADAGEITGDTGHDGRRPPALPEKVVEPRCGDVVRFYHLDESGFFKTTVTNRYEDAPNNYSFTEIGGTSVLSMDENEFADLYETGKSALWPRVFAEIDFFNRCRDPETDGITARSLEDGDR